MPRVDMYRRLTAFLCIASCLISSCWIQSATAQKMGGMMNSTDGEFNMNMNEVVNTTDDGKPKHYGVLLFPAFEALDVFGPVNVLQTLARRRQMTLAMISNGIGEEVGKQLEGEEELSPVSNEARSSRMNRFNSSFSQAIVPTHSVASPPEQLDVLIIPGGIGTIAPDLNGTIDYIRTTYPKLQYIITVCTGARLAAKAGILDGKRATTNKAAFDRVTPLAPDAKWIRQARWTEDGKVWTSSGVTAGIDATLAFVEKIYSAEAAEEVATSLEYERTEDPDNDPFADLDYEDISPKRVRRSV